MKRSDVAWSVAFFLMAAASVFLVTTDNPENAAVVSDDAKVTVTGVARAASPFTVTAMVPPVGKIFAGSAYTVAPDGAMLEAPVVLAFSLAEFPFAVGDAVVYRYNEDGLMWELVNPIIAHTDDALAVEVRELGIFALGVREVVASPNFLSVYEELRDSRPKDAVGYVITAGYARADESIVRLAAVGEQGGCGGAVMPGVREERSVVNRDIVLLVNDVETPVRMTFLARWFIRDGDACDSRLPFHAADEYGILPTS